MAVANELTGVPDMSAPSSDFERQLAYVANMKKAILMVAGAAVQKLMMSLAKEQSDEHRRHVGNTIESTVLRVQKLAQQKGGTDDLALQLAIMNVYTYEASEWIHSAGKEALSFAER